MNAGHGPGEVPTVCPFVALAEDRDRRADGPDPRNRCYAERAPRQRDLVYQSEYCYSKQFAACSVFLAWAARNAAEPAYVTEAARRAWGSGVSAPEIASQPPDEEALELAWEPAASPAAPGMPSHEDGFGAAPPPASSDEPGSGAGSLDWVSASAWADAPWIEAEDEPGMDDDVPEEALEPEADAEAGAAPQEALTAPRVPAALPMRRRRRELSPIRTRGSGEWRYADPPDREPIVRRRYGLAPSILVAVIGLLVVALIVFLLPTLLSGSGSGTASAPATADPLASAGPLQSRAPGAAATPRPSLAPSPQASPRERTYRVRSGDSLSAIAARFGVPVQQLQCRNRILNRNIIGLGQRLVIPPEDYTCPPGWRNSTPEPIGGSAPEPTPGSAAASGSEPEPS